MTDMSILIFGVVVFGLMLVGIYLTVIEFRQLSAENEAESDSTTPLSNSQPR